MHVARQGTRRARQRVKCRTERMSEYSNRRTTDRHSSSVAYDLLSLALWTTGSANATRLDVCSFCTFHSVINSCPFPIEVLCQTFFLYYSKKIVKKFLAKIINTITANSFEQISMLYWLRAAYNPLARVL